MRSGPIAAGQRGMRDLPHHQPAGLDQHRPGHEPEGERGQERQPDRDQSRRTREAQRYSRKKARRSSASATGSSIAAKWPPAGITVQRRMLYTRSAHARGGRTISFGNAA